MNIIPQNGSPFEEIRRVDANGDHWSGRDLMPLLGYTKWERFTDAVERAKFACDTSGQRVADHFPGAGKMVQVGSGAVRSVADFRLTRYACYLVAMNGDPRKPEIAAAQTYFAVKTREAETMPVVPAELSRAEILRMALAAEEELAEATAKVVELAPKAEYVDAFVSTDDLMLIGALASQVGLGPQALRNLLAEHKWIYRKYIGRRWSDKNQRLVDEYEWWPSKYGNDHGYFMLRPQHKAPRHHNNQLRQTLYVTPRGAQAINRLVIRGRASGPVVLGGAA